MYADRLQNEDPAPEDIQFLEDRLYEFNSAATGVTDGRILGVFLRDEAENIVAVRRAIPGERPASSARSGWPSLFADGALVVV
jgi:hypothetical protein